MRRRLLAAAAALVLAVLGSVVLVTYARGADQRAMAGMATVQVLVVAEPVAAGTPVAELAALVRTEELPAVAAVPGRVTDLADLTGQVAVTDLQPGEQLLAGRFAAPESLQTPGTVAVPEGLAEVSVLLEPQRAVGGRLVAGDEVGVLISFATPTTHATLDRVLVTQVQGAPAPAVSGAEAGTETASAGSPAPSASLLVTLALPVREAEQVVFGAEHGTLWLALEPADADLEGTEVITPGNVYREDLS
ncbi:RcpC/CpaB family pilus assembly protein [Modestobacter sp. VKM Ac-2986]|uniref:Flp pilus assembly protein CpaB n=1 Tax=Modestobacter sp. VKM Ac-2986 TaxID=3004140 RepID=UPI0022AA26BF|nr:RcpC/CpaB family pilus assembly protein [Modestobacter sp. VKM Ac-2986]MCZ2828433.1 RcpC/CpaB family pilus assembly protein [Modestobacter sp. VKM Ac-2986]